MEMGAHGIIAEIAAAEKINQSYLCRVLRLTLLAPTIVEAVLDGSQGTSPQLHDLMKPFPLDWNVQGNCLM
jgi:hypothetical protein